MPSKRNRPPLISPKLTYSSLLGVIEALWIWMNLKILTCMCKRSLYCLKHSQVPPCWIFLKWRYMWQKLCHLLINAYVNVTTSFWQQQNYDYINIYFSTRTWLSVPYGYLYILLNVHIPHVIVFHISTTWFQYNSLFDKWVMYIYLSVEIMYYIFHTTLTKYTY